MDIAKAIRDRAEELNVSQADLCRATGMSRAYMSQLFSGKIPDPKASNVYKIAHALGLSVDDLLERSHVEYYYIVLDSKTDI